MDGVLRRKATEAAVPLPPGRFVVLAEVRFVVLAEVGCGVRETLLDAVCVRRKPSLELAHGMFYKELICIRGQCAPLLRYEREQCGPWGCLAGGTSTNAGALESVASSRLQGEPLLRRKVRCGMVRRPACRVQGAASWICHKYALRPERRSRLLRRARMPRLSSRVRVPLSSKVGLASWRRAGSILAWSRGRGLPQKAALGQPPAPREVCRAGFRLHRVKSRILRRFLFELVYCHAAPLIRRPEIL